MQLFKLMKQILWICKRTVENNLSGIKSS